MSDDDIVQIRQHYPNLYVLRYYSIENYLYHPDNLEEYYQSANQPFQKGQYITDLTEAKNGVKDLITPTLGLKRTEYPYFGEPEYNNKPLLQNRFKNKDENFEESASVASYLSSNDFATYYKSLPMKTYCTQLPQRQNISRVELSKTDWFRQQVTLLLQA